MHLHRELLRQILDEETLRNLLDEEAVRSVDSKSQYKIQRKARSANELARILLELGDLVDIPDEDISILDRVDGDARLMLSELVSAHRVVPIHIPTVETNRERWISTENFPLYRSAFGMEIQTDGTDEKIIQLLEKSAFSFEESSIDNIEITAVAHINTLPVESTTIAGEA
jgi:ATP-dependent Lhr-like helicase